MVCNLSRIRRLSASVAVILVALAVAMPAGVYAQARRPATAPVPPPQKKSEPEILFERAEKAYIAKSYKAAAEDFDKVLTTYGNVLPSKACAMLELRIAACAQAQKDWATAEKYILLFLKRPNGTEDLLDKDNNYRGIAQVTLADVYAKQQKWDLAINLLAAIIRPTNISLRLQDRARAAIALTRIYEEKNKEATAGVIKKTALDSIEILRIFTAQRQYNIPEIKDAANRIVELYIKAGDTKAAQMLQDEISARVTKSPLDEVTANFQRIEIAHSLWEQAESLPREEKEVRNPAYRMALTTFQECLRRNALAALVDEAIKAQNALVDEAKRTLPEKPTDEQKDAVAKLEAKRDALQKAIDDFSKSKDYDAYLSYRIGLCLIELERHWEAYIALRDVLVNHPGFSRASAAYYYYIRTLRA
ncbi:MAG: hypothetical protein LBV54_07065, partial [Puniceicoccales bacterium]|nr:hypothetical protein [Puniceicoccales bacterium]